jgi:nucleotide-binding universal stress UspA family protein
MLANMKTILAAVDFSQIAQKVVDGASALAEAMQAKLVLLNVWEPIASYVPVGAAMDVITAPVPVEPPDLNLVKERLEQFASPLRSKGLSVETLVSTALPVDEILNQSKRLAASMIVLGSHGHGALFQLFSGSVVTSVLHKSSIPVTVIPVHGS